MFFFKRKIKWWRIILSYKGTNEDLFRYYLTNFSYLFKLWVRRASYRSRVGSLSERCWVGSDGDGALCALALITGLIQWNVWGALVNASCVTTPCCEFSFGIVQEILNDSCAICLLSSQVGLSILHDILSEFLNSCMNSLICGLELCSPCFSLYWGCTGPFCWAVISGLTYAWAWLSYLEAV